MGNEIFSAIFFVFGGVMTGYLLFRDDRFFALFRSVGFVVASVIVFMFNLNWLSGLPMPLVLATAAVLVMAGISVLMSRGRSTAKMEDWTVGRYVWGIPILLTFIVLLLGASYFHWELDVPRYRTPDSGTHFLYMSQAAETGMMPLFSENVIYPASGFIESFRHHNEQYFPGSTAAFLLVDRITLPDKQVTSFQYFNIFFVALLSGYFFAFVMRHTNFRFRYPALFFVGFFSVFGIFFDFIFNSFSTQLLGLFLLLFFVDTYHESLSRRLPLIIPILGLSAMIMTYFYWLPIALLFVLFSNLSSVLDARRSFRMLVKRLADMAMVPVGAGVLAFGYIALVIVGMDMVGHAADDGGFPLQDMILSDVLLFAPFAMVHLYRMARMRFSDRKPEPVTDFSLSVLVYSAGLMICYYVFSVVTHYVALKVMYILLPVAWVLVIAYGTDIFHDLSGWVREKKYRFWRSGLYGLIRTKTAAVFLVLFIVVGVAAYLEDIDIRLIPLEMKNVEFAFDNPTDANLSREQMKLVDWVRYDRPDLLQENRIFVIGSATTSYWVYAYSRIWPRTPSLLASGEGTDSILSPMSFFSEGNYETWRKNDPQHVLLYIQGKSSKQWAKKWSFRREDYDVLKSERENAVLKLKTD